MASNVLIRCIRRYRQSLSLDAVGLYDAEFCNRLGEPELELSVYSVPTEQWLSAFMCHRASSGADFPRFARAVDVSMIRNDSALEHVPNCKFSALSAAHRVLKFTDEVQLRGFVQELVDAVASRRARVFEESKDNLKRWLRERRKIGDAEWQNFLSAKSDDDTWAKHARVSGSTPPPSA
jgi:hypothetical protein